VYGGIGAAQTGAAALAQRRPDGTRTLVAIDAAERLRERFPDAEERDRVEVLAPPAVNAHTHLDLSAMSFTPGAYEDFVAAAIAQTRSGGRGVEAARRGIDALRACGVRTVGDIVASEGVMALLLSEPELTGVAYWEVIGPDPDDAPRLLDEARERLQRFLSWQRPGGMRVGLSPHAPHTVSAPLLRGLVELARSLRLPLQIHVAEAPGERALHASGTGPLRVALGGALRDWRPSGMSPVAYLEDLGVLAARPTLVHMVEVDEDDVRRVARAGCVVVHCPRSNEALECATFPWATFARHGVSVALGTDSLGSSPDLCPVAEWRAAVALHGGAASRAQLVWAAVKGGARALGLRPETVRRGDPFDALTTWGAAVH
jgi:aminodeoxyfutalosine deaminase